MGHLTALGPDAATALARATARTRGSAGRMTLASPDGPESRP